ncbi:MAG: hypothetical protein K2F97_09725 [Muribaculaceae bacterium]|nr:hypothetical protein [Muribaculaceae bacterium]
MPHTITVKFVDFWPTFDEYDNKFLAAMQAGADVAVLPSSSAEEPDILFYSRCGLRHLDYQKSVKVYFTGENDVPDFNECDYALSFHHLEFGDRHLRYPLYMLYEYDELTSAPRVGAEAAGRPFCSFLMRNSANCDPMRIEIVDAVEDMFGPIAYGGPWRNNTGGPVGEKIPFIARYKFNLALENTRLQGYVTEKILEPFVAGTVPLYWGPDDVVDDFNPEAFLRVGDYHAIGGFLDALSALNRDDRAYMKMLMAPKLNADRHVDFDARLADFLGAVVSAPRKRTVAYGEAGMHHRTRRLLRPFVQSSTFMRMAGALERMRR